MGPNTTGYPCLISLENVYSISLEIPRTLEIMQKITIFCVIFEFRQVWHSQIQFIDYVKPKSEAPTYLLIIKTIII